MSYIDNNQIIIDAILTFEGRKKFREAQFQITKFALSDSEIDYILNEKNIMRLPVLEAGVSDTFTQGEALKRLAPKPSEAVIKVSYFENAVIAPTQYAIDINTDRYGSEEYDIYTSDVSILRIEDTMKPGVYHDPLGNDIVLYDNYGSLIKKSVTFWCSGWIVLIFNPPGTATVYTPEVDYTATQKLVEDMTEINEVQIDFIITGRQSGATFEEKIIVTKPPAPPTVPEITTM